LVVAPLGGADWVTHSGSNQRDGWQRNETKISKDTLKDLKLLWKIRLETKQRSVYSLYGPLIVERSITDRGFKEIAFVAGADNDLMSPLKFLPPNGKPYSLASVDNVIYTITGQGCGGNPNSVYSVDLNDPGHTVRYWRSGSGGLWGTAGPAIGSDGTVYAETGGGQYDPATNRYANSVVALKAKELKVKDWYTPSNAEWLFKRDLDMNVTPVVVPYKG